MATRHWVSTDGAWSSTSSWSGATVPVSGDTIIFRGRNNLVPPMSGLDQTAVVQFAEIIVESSYSLPIGARGNPFMGCVAIVRHFGSGQFHWKAEADIPLASTYVYVDAPRMCDANLVISGPGTGTGDFISALKVQSGHVDVEPTIDVYAIETIGPKALVKLWGSAVSYALNMMDGEAYTERALTTGTNDLDAIQCGGIWRNRGTTSSTQLAVCGGRFLLEDTDATGGVVNGVRGFVDGTQTTYAKTIARLHQYPDCTVKQGSGTVITNWHTYQVN